LLKPAVLATWKVKIGRIEVKANPGKKFIKSHFNQRLGMVVPTCRPSYMGKHKWEICSPGWPRQKNSWRHRSEFNPQYHHHHQQKKYLGVAKTDSCYHARFQGLEKGIVPDTPGKRTIAVGLCHSVGAAVLGEETESPSKISM
jgi:hypothetical protein